MRNLESSPRLEKPGLVEIKAIQQGRLRANEFILNISITRAAIEDDSGKAARKPPAKR
jgi:hypothetical protein